MKIVAFIPARLESKRFPNKVIKSIYNIPMIEHVRRRAIISGAFHFDAFDERFGNFKHEDWLLEKRKAFK